MTRLRLVAGFFFGAAFVPFACGSPPRAVTPFPQPPVPALSPAESAKVWSEAQAVFENRCVVCHGCYDAPCQLKLGTLDGIVRGASADKVYDSTRLVAASPTRLDVDAHDAEGWRKKGFHPVLPEGAATDPGGSLLLRMLDLKRRGPLPVEDDLSKTFTLNLDRKETCTTAEHFPATSRRLPPTPSGHFRPSPWNPAIASCWKKPSSPWWGSSRDRCVADRWRRTSSKIVSGSHFSGPTSRG